MHISVQTALTYNNPFPNYRHLKKLFSFWMLKCWNVGVPEEPLPLRLNWPAQCISPPLFTTEKYFSLRFLIKKNFPQKSRKAIAFRFFTKFFKKLNLLKLCRLSLYGPYVPLWLFVRSENPLFSGTFELNILVEMLAYRKNFCPYDSTDLPNAFLLLCLLRKSTFPCVSW